MENPFPPSNCVVHEDDVDWGGEITLDKDPTITYVYSMKGMNTNERKENNPNS